LKVLIEKEARGGKSTCEEKNLKKTVISGFGVGESPYLGLVYVERQTVASRLPAPFSHLKVADLWGKLIMEVNILISLVSESTTRLKLKPSHEHLDK
jgi:hypothetical protein